MSKETELRQLLAGLRMPIDLRSALLVAIDAALDEARREQA